MILICKDNNVHAFTCGKKYVCLGVESNVHHKVTYVCLQRDSDGTPVFENIEGFDFVVNEISEGWGVFHYGDGLLRIQPIEFSGEFWELYNDGDPSAEKIFDKVCSSLKLKYASNLRTE